MATQVTETETFSAENWITGSGDVETTEVSIASGQNIEAKEALAINTTTGKVVTYAEAGANGTNNAVYIAVHAVDATGGEEKAQVYKAGQFNPNEVVWSGTPTNAQKAVAFVGTPISLQEPQA